MSEIVLYGMSALAAAFLVWSVCWIGGIQATDQTKDIKAAMEKP